jgi:hypothetical protein
VPDPDFRFGVVFSVDKLNLLSTDTLQPDTPRSGRELQLFGAFLCGTAPSAGDGV